MIKVYTTKDIKKVYKRHAYECGSVVYSEDYGITWKSVPMDSGKWDIDNWVFAFIQ